jgi:hypothetical protein
MCVLSTYYTYTNITCNTHAQTDRHIHRHIHRHIDRDRDRDTATDTEIHTCCSYRTHMATESPKES